MRSSIFLSAITTTIFSFETEGVVDEKRSTESNSGFVAGASATKILGIAQAITPIEAAYQLKRVHPSALSPAGLGPDYWCLSAPKRASNPFYEHKLAKGGAALAFYAKAENVHISTNVVGDIEGLRYTAILT